MPRRRKTPEPVQEMPVTVNFEKFAGSKASLYYNNHLNRFQLGDVEFEVMEDECDGYRSCLGEIKVIRVDAPRKDGDFLGIVNVQKVFENDFDGFHLVDESGHIWLTFGTDNVDDYYPCFRFYFQAKKDHVKDVSQSGN